MQYIRIFHIYSDLVPILANLIPNLHTEHFLKGSVNAKASNNTGVFFSLD